MRLFSSSTTWWKQNNDVFTEAELEQKRKKAAQLDAEASAQRTVLNGLLLTDVIEKNPRLEEEMSPPLIQRIRAAPDYTYPALISELTPERAALSREMDGCCGLEKDEVKALQGIQSSRKGGARDVHTDPG